MNKKVKKGIKLVISMALVLTIALINPINLIPHHMFAEAPEEHEEYLLTQDGRRITEEEHQHIHEEMSTLSALNTVSAVDVNSPTTSEPSPNRCPYTTLCTAGTSNYRFSVDPWNDPRWPYHGDNGGGGNDLGNGILYYQVIISYFTCNVCGGKSAVSYRARWGGVTYAEYNAHDNNPQNIVHKNITKYRAHAWGEAYQTQANTCTTGTHMKKACSQCGAAWTWVCNDALGHAWDNGVVTTPPKCLTQGVLTYSCQRCGTKTTSPIGALGHNYELTLYTPPNAEKDGSNQYTCTRCGDVIYKTVKLADWRIFTDLQIQHVCLGDREIPLGYIGDSMMRNVREVQ